MEVLVFQDRAIGHIALTPIRQPAFLFVHPLSKSFNFSARKNFLDWLMIELEEIMLKIDYNIILITLVF